MLHTEIEARIRAAQAVITWGELHFHFYLNDFNRYRITLWCASGNSTNNTVAAGRTIDECLDALDRYVAAQAPALAAE